MPEFNAGTELTYLEKDDILMSGSPTDFSRIKAQNVFNRSLTYAQLEALVTASALIPAMWYKITNATSANFNLLVQAIAVNKIGCDAKDPLYPNDVVKYNFASNVITWRWDTVNDISAGEDWRNSNNISIGTGCSKITIGIDCEITIGNNCSNIKIGNGCTVTLFAGSTNINIDNSCLFINPSHVSSYINVLYGSGVTCDNTISNNEFRVGINLTSISNKSLVYNNNGFLLNGEGDQYFQYITGGVLTLTLLV